VIKALVLATIAFPPLNCFEFVHLSNMHALMLACRLIRLKIPCCTAESSGQGNLQLSLQVVVSDQEVTSPVKAAVIDYAIAKLCGLPLPLFCKANMLAVQEALADL